MSRRVTVVDVDPLAPGPRPRWSPLDILLGLVFPPVCLLADPMVFRSLGSSPALLGDHRAVLLGVAVAYLAFFLGSRRPETLRGWLGGMLGGGALLAGTLGAILFLQVSWFAAPAAFYWAGVLGAWLVHSRVARFSRTVQRLLVVSLAAGFLLTFPLVMRILFGSVALLPMGTAFVFARGAVRHLRGPASGRGAFAAGMATFVLATAVLDLALHRHATRVLAQLQDEDAAQAYIAVDLLRAMGWLFDPDRVAVLYRTEAGVNEWGDLLGSDEVPWHTRRLAWGYYELTASTVESRWTRFDD